MILPNKVYTDPENSKLSIFQYGDGRFRMNVYSQPIDRRGYVSTLAEAKKHIALEKKKGIWNTSPQFANGQARANQHIANKVAERFGNEFKEADHPREGGKFAKKGGGSGTSTEKAEPKKEVTTVSRDSDTYKEHEKMLASLPSGKMTAAEANAVGKKLKEAGYTQSRTTTERGGTYRVFSKEGSRIQLSRSYRDDKPGMSAKEKGGWAVQVLFPRHSWDFS